MPIDFTGSNKWHRVYVNTIQGNPENRKIKAPLIEPFEIPLLFESHILAITAIYNEARPRWRTSGYLKQVYSGINLEASSDILTVNSPTSGVDAATQRIGLNTLEMVRFPKLAENFYLWFDPVHWMPKLTLFLWEFQGEETPSNTEELIDTVKVDLVRIESKIDFINTYGNQ